MHGETVKLKMIVCSWFCGVMYRWIVIENGERWCSFLFVCLLCCSD